MLMKIVMGGCCSEDELRELRYANVMVYMLECENNASKQHIEGPSGRPHPTRRRSAHINTPKTRPLHEKVREYLGSASEFKFDTWRVRRSFVIRMKCCCECLYSQCRQTHNLQDAIPDI